MNHLNTWLGFTLLLLFCTKAWGQTDNLTDEDIVEIKLAAERSFSDYQRIMNDLANPKMLNIYRDSVIAESDDIFTENAKIEVDYDSAYLPPHMPYEVAIEKYLGDFYTYYHRDNSRNRVNVYYTNRRLSDVKWDEEEGSYYLTIDYTSIYDGLLPQQRIATFKADKANGEWKARITYIKFKNLSREQDDEKDDPIGHAGQETAVRQEVQKQEDTHDESAQDNSAGDIELNELADGGKKGEKYVISWQLPEDDHPVSVLLLPKAGAAQPIATAHIADRLEWTIDKEIKPGKYQIKVLDEQMLASVTSPQFRISSRFPLGLKLAIGAGVGYYLVQTVRHDWNFAWPFGTSDVSVPIKTEEPDLPGPPSVPE